MIQVRLHGRLGNQMFQYAAGRALALRHNTDVALDTRSAVDRNEGVLTRVFDLPLTQADHQPPYKGDGLLRYAAWRYLGGPPRFQRERGLGYNPGFEDWEDGIYLHGYWQSERYFADIAETVRADFTFPEQMSEQNAEMAAQIGAGTSVSLHVRRGDYLSTGAHGVCDQAYYTAAIDALLPKIDGEPTIYVFSDDPAWARDNLTLPCPRIVVDFNGPEADYEDMRLMSFCDHNIIANSSFSWWAAWLNDNPAKEVAGPANWFSDPKLSNPDILPDRWLTVQA
ncbi:alpha-1,2-fucosyltransferase [Thalassococcus sp. S3]|uniref:alpha-1,2-fucosyltransferase n=1 Tax=Thalassococcus sp. S3 TaxID=2017482 RepID=UPI00102425FD|nr:alpha-1,2-fucosyltransferase [Thalassococcus sp. S3]QBF33762.1 alpha-1,2-fucosyltransferase [Thalassococcus sp. S3]